MNQDQIRNIKELANEFFQAAQEYVQGQEGGLKSILTMTTEGPPLGMDNNVQRKQDMLVKQCVRSLGVELGSDEEIEELVWDHFWRNFSNTDPISDISEITERFLYDISRYEQRSYGYLAPNFVIKFSDQAQKLSLVL